MCKRKIIIMCMCGTKRKGKCNDGRKRNGGRKKRRRKRRRRNKRKQSQRRKRAKKVRSNECQAKCTRIIFVDSGLSFFLSQLVLDQEVESATFPLSSVSLV